MVQQALAATPDHEPVANPPVVHTLKVSSEEQEPHPTYQVRARTRLGLIA
jgi:hypothetical protein